MNLRTGDDDGMVTITTVCPSCKKEHKVAVPEKGLRQYNAGAHAQDAFPGLSPEDRELIISGICPGCWDAMFEHEEECDEIEED